MIIIYKITDYFPETDQIAVKFCREKSPISIDDYNPIAINLKDIDAYDVESFWWVCNKFRFNWGVVTADFFGCTYRIRNFSCILTSICFCDFNMYLFE